MAIVSAISLSEAVLSQVFFLFTVINRINVLLRADSHINVSLVIQIVINFHSSSFSDANSSSTLHDQAQIFNINWNTSRYLH